MISILQEDIGRSFSLRAIHQKQEEMPAGKLGFYITIVVPCLTRFYMIKVQDVANDRWMRVLSDARTIGAHVINVCSMDGLRDYSFEFSLQTMQTWTTKLKGKFDVKFIVQKQMALLLSPGWR